MSAYGRLSPRQLYRAVFTRYNLVGQAAQRAPSAHNDWSRAVTYLPIVTGTPHGAIARRRLRNEWDQMAHPAAPVVWTVRLSLNQSSDSADACGGRRDVYRAGQSKQQEQQGEP